MTDLVAPGADENAEAQLTEAEIQEQKEWDDALADTYESRLDKSQETEEDESAVTTTTTTTIAPEKEEPAATTTTTTTLDPNETADAKAEREARENAAADKANGDDGESEAGAENGTRSARQTQREIAKQVEETVADVREKMFTIEDGGKKFLEGSDGRRYLYTEGKPVLSDGSGDPITSIADVMKLTNPLTIGSEENPDGRAFTEDEAATWLLSATQRMNDDMRTMDKTLDTIANTNLDFQDQADTVNANYGDLLKAMPDLQKKLWAQFEKTLVQDKKTGIVTGMPVSLEEFYDTALEPYVTLAENLEAQAEADKQRDKELEKTRKSVKRADRSDIFGDGKVDDMDDDEKEWAAAAKDYYGR